MKEKHICVRKNLVNHYVPEMILMIKYSEFEFAGIQQQVLSGADPGFLEREYRKGGGGGGGGGGRVCYF